MKTQNPPHTWTAAQKAKMASVLPKLPTAYFDTRSNSEAFFLAEKLASHGVKAAARSAYVYSDRHTTAELASLCTAAIE